MSARLLILICFQYRVKLLPDGKPLAVVQRCECNPILRQLALRRTAGRIYSCDMEPGEKFMRRILKFVFMIVAFVIAVVFGEFSFGMGWVGAVIFVIGASMGALAIYLLEGPEKLGVRTNLDPTGQSVKWRC